MDFSRIRELRKAAHKSQDDLAIFLGVNRATISKYETGAIEPPTAQLVKIATFLNVRLEDLLGGLETFNSHEEFDARWKEVISNPDGHQIDVIHKVGGVEIIDHKKNHLIDIYEKLDEADQGQLVKYGDLLAGQAKYKD